MRAAILAMGLAVLAVACSKSSEPVGENSAGSIKTTAVGEIVGTIPSPTPTSNAANDDATTANAADLDTAADNLTD